MEAMDSISGQVTLNIPPEYIVIKKSEFEEIQSRADYDRWWSTDDLYERYGHRLNWFKDHVLYVPKYKRELSRFVHEPNGGKDSWQFEPHRFSEFLSNHFNEIFN